MGVLIQIRDVDDSVRARLKARAAARGVSFNAYLRALLRDAADRPNVDHTLATIAARRDKIEPSSTALIRADRDGRS